MGLSLERVRTYTDILKEELIPAMGCTEPIAIAYASSIIANALGAHPDELKVGLSGNIIKNVKSVVVPATGGMQGIESAIGAGIIASCPEKRLEVLCGLGADSSREIKSYLEGAKLEIYELETENAFEILIEGVHNGNIAVARLAKRHTNIVYVTLNGESITSRYATTEDTVEKESTDRSTLNVQDIVEFADTVDLDELTPYLERQIEFNMAIAREGISGEWGVSIGKTLYSIANGNVRVLARAYASAGSDERLRNARLHYLGQRQPGYDCLYPRCNLR